MGFRRVIPGFGTVARPAAILALAVASAPSLAAQTLASYETIAPNLTSEPRAAVAPVRAKLPGEISASLLESASFQPTALATTSALSLSATWQDRSGWRAGGSLFNPAQNDLVAFGLWKQSAPQSSFAFDMEHPSLLTAGLGYRDLSGWRFGAEVHLVEMIDTGGLDREGYSTDANATAIQWRSSPVVTFGGVVPLGDNLSLSSGFTWNRNQVRLLDYAFNALAPGLLQSSFNLGLRWQWNHDVQWFVNYRSGHADYLSADVSTALSDLATIHDDGALNVMSLMIGVELSL